MIWNPIETAKKDSTGVLGWFPTCRCVFDMVWDEYSKEWRSFGGCGDFHGEQPTHWMSMPERPE